MNLRGRLLAVARLLLLASVALHRASALNEPSVGVSSSTLSSVDPCRNAFDDELAATGVRPWPDFTTCSEELCRNLAIFDGCRLRCGQCIPSALPVDVESNTNDAAQAASESPAAPSGAPSPVVGGGSLPDRDGGSADEPAPPAAHATVPTSAAAPAPPLLAVDPPPIPAAAAAESPSPSGPAPAPSPSPVVWPAPGPTITAAAPARLASQPPPPPPELQQRQQPPQRPWDEPARPLWEPPAASEGVPVTDPGAVPSGPRADDGWGAQWPTAPAADLPPFGSDEFDRRPEPSGGAGYGGPDGGPPAAAPGAGAAPAWRAGPAPGRAGPEEPGQGRAMLGIGGLAALLLVGALLRSWARRSREAADAAGSHLPSFPRKGDMYGGASANSPPPPYGKAADLEMAPVAPVRESLASRLPAHGAEAAALPGWVSFTAGGSAGPAGADTFGSACTDRPRAAPPPKPARDDGAAHAQHASYGGRRAAGDGRGAGASNAQDGELRVRTAEQDEPHEGYEYGSRARAPAGRGARGAGTGRYGALDAESGEIRPRGSPRASVGAIASALPAALPQGLQKARAAGAAAAASMRPRGQAYGKVALAEDDDDDEML